MTKHVLWALLLGSAVVEAQDVINSNAQGDTRMGMRDNIKIVCRPCRFQDFVREWMKKSNRGIQSTDTILAKGKPVKLGVLKGDPYVILDEVFAEQPYLMYERSGDDVLIKDKPYSPGAIPDEPVTELVHGCVSDSFGNPLVGASIRVKNRPGGIATDHMGRYHIQLVPEDVVRFSHVGYVTKVLKWDGTKSEMNVQLKAQETPLQETVVSGYRNLHSSWISSIEEIPVGDQDASTVWEAVRGRIPGVFITQENGAPGGSYRINIRGQNSIGAVLKSRPNSEPLYVVDGNAFFMPEGKLNVLTSGGNNEPTPDIYSTGFNPLYLIVPSDIQDITILKDAVSTAMYGARGANGVVLIRTKRPIAGKSGLQFATQVGAGKSTRMMEMMNTSQYVDMRLEAFRNDDITPDPANAPDLFDWDTDRNVNYVRYLLGGTAWNTQQQLAWSGGNTHFKFRIGGSYRLETSVLPAKVRAKRRSVFANGSYTTKDNALTLRLSSYQANGSYRSVLGYLLQAQLLAPHAPALTNHSGNLVWNEKGLSFTNPLGLTNSTNELDATATSSLFTAQVKLNNELSFENSISWQHIDITETAILPIAAQNPFNDPSGSKAHASNRYNTWSVEPQLHYNKKLNDMHIVCLAGVAWFERVNNRMIFSYGGYSSDDDLHDPHLASSRDSTPYRNRHRYFSIYTKADVSWLDRYYVNFTIRRDGSSRFGPDYRFGTFAAGGLAWKFTRDIFQGDSGLFSGKLHFTYGLTGNDQIGDLSYLGTWTNLPANGDPQGGEGIVPATVYNKRLKWETVHKLEIGLSLGFFDDQLLIDANWYQHRSSDQIIIQPLAGQSGFSSIVSNFPATLENTGLELHVTHRYYNHKFSWNSMAMVTFPRNRLVSFPGLSNSLYKNVLEIGKSITDEKRFLYNRVDPQTGVYLLQDSTNLYSAGNLDPTMFGGLNNSFTYGDFTLEVLLEGRVQRAPHYLSYVLSYVLPGSTNSDMYNNLPADLNNHWRNPGDVAPYQKLTASYISDVAIAHTNWRNSNARFTDASFLRLKMIYFGYTVHNHRRKKTRIEQVTLSLSAENLATWTSYRATDPETLNPFLLPPEKRITFGISITLK